MNYLNNRITQRIDLGAAPAKGMYKYEVQVYDMYYSTWNTIFVGNYFNNGERFYTFDITDICRNRKSTLHTSGSTDIDIDVNIVEQYRITVTKDNNGNTVSGSPFFVAHIYTYPNLQYGYDPGLGPDNVFFDINTRIPQYLVSVLLQGTNKSRTPASTKPSMYLMPQYPNVDNSQDLRYYNTMTFGLSIETGSAIQDIKIISVERGKDYSNQNNWLGQYDMSHLNVEYYTHTFFGSFGNFIDDSDSHIPDYDIDVYITWKNASDVNQYKKVAEIKSCKERYYLLWQDRYGSYQSQPFKGKMEYSEDITNEEILSYTGRRRKSNVTIQPKWKLNSGWLKEKLFPLYESIYVSPILKLYDTKTGHEYDVILKDTPYVEKKYLNDKKLLSIELNLEATETQNIIY